MIIILDMSGCFWIYVDIVYMSCYKMCFLLLCVVHRGLRRLVSDDSGTDCLNN